MTCVLTAWHPCQVTDPLHVCYHEACNITWLSSCMVVSPRAPTAAVSACIVFTSVLRTSSCLNLISRRVRGHSHKSLGLALRSATKLCAAVQYRGADRGGWHAGMQLPRVAVWAGRQMHQDTPGVGLLTASAVLLCAAATVLANAARHILAAFHRSLQP